MKYTGYNVRHGDLGLFSIDELPSGLIASETKVLMTGSGGNDHIFDKGTFYAFSEGQVVGYLVAEGTTLLHPDHGKKGKGMRKAQIEDGIYQCKRQIEATHDGMRSVVD